MNKSLWQQTTLLDRLEHWASERPDTIVVTMVDDGGNDRASSSYSTLRNEARAIANHLLHERKVQPGTRLLLVYPPSLDFLHALVGCMMAGVHTGTGCTT